MSELKWRLPTKEELDKMYQNLHKKEVGGFANDLYWSSSALNSLYAWLQDFNDGYQYDDNKNLDNKNLDKRVRAVGTFNLLNASKYCNIGQYFSDGIVFDIQDSTVFVCKIEDEEGTYTWDDAMKLFGEKEEKQMEQNKKWYKWMEIDIAGIWYKRAVVELFDDGKCRFIIDAEDENHREFKLFLNNKLYPSNYSEYYREIEEPEYKPYDKITPELRYSLLKDGYLLNGDWIEVIDKVHEKGGVVMVDDNLYTLHELFTTYRFLDGGVIGELK